MPVDRDYTREMLARLVQIDSINPTLSPTGAGEGPLARFVTSDLSQYGLQTQVLEPEPGRATAVARLAGSGGGRSLMLIGHIDTVGIEGMADPFSSEVRDGRMYGRGTYDMKGGIAACMAAIRALATEGPRLAGDVVLAGVADEEYGSLGTMDLLHYVRTDGALLAEPTALDTCIAHKGYLWIDVTVTGRAAHGSRFDLGIDANMKMGAFLYELSKLERDLRTRTPHPLIGPPSLHASMLSGGSGLSTYAAQCSVKVERRTIPGETVADAVAEIQAIVDRLAAADPDFHAVVDCFLDRDPFEVPETAPIVVSLDRASQRVRGVTPKHVGDTPWMDAALLASAGIETAIFGGTGTGAHAAVEWVDLESIYTLADTIVELARDYCG